VGPPCSGGPVPHPNSFYFHSSQADYGHQATNLTPTNRTDRSVQPWQVHNRSHSQRQWNHLRVTSVPFASEIGRLRPPMKLNTTHWRCQQGILPSTAHYTVHTVLPTTSTVSKHWKNSFFTLTELFSSFSYKTTKLREGKQNCFRSPQRRHQTRGTLFRA